ncbi:MAG: DNA repair protein RecO [Deltaproteobacteria bacterium]|nr:DNA repair protein RecO [Deltaproteobacteria bacterium]
MPLYSTEAVVIRTRDYRESDRIVTFFTRDFGKISGIARSARRSTKRFSGSLDLFCHVMVQFFEKRSQNLVRVEGCDLLAHFHHIRQDVRKMAHMSYLVELILLMAPEREKQAELFDLLLQVQGVFNTGPYSSQKALFFEMRFLALLGYAPHLNNCLSCGAGIESGRSFGFHPERGGLLCSRCAIDRNELVGVSLGTLKLLDAHRLLGGEKAGRLVFSPLALNELQRLLRALVIHKLGRKPRSMGFMEQFMGTDR